MKIVVDAMGGDYAPRVVVEGVMEALKESDVNIALVGVEDRIREELAPCNYDSNRIEVIHAPDVVEMDDPATVTIRKKRNSSISVGINLLKEEGYSAFISAGNTGAVVAASTIYLGMIPGVERPAIGVVIPTLKSFAFLMDAGANTGPKPEHLLQWAVMADVYAREVLGVADPSMGLLNIGEEETKGTEFVRETHRMMSERLANFVGNVEASGVFSGKCDCIICDGFLGNVVLKVSESLTENAGKLMKREVKKSPVAMLGAFLLKSRLKHIRRLADYSEYGGAPLLGVNGIVMICHGRSSVKAIKNAIRATRTEIEHQIIKKMKVEIEK